jgi:alpha-mannosidase
VTSATLSEDGLSVALALAQPPSAEVSQLQLSIVNVRDISPSGNAVAATSNTIALSKPIYTLDSIVCDGATSKEIPFDGLPCKTNEPFSINLFVRTDEEPANRTIIAGFGHADDEADATGRYICKFAQGVHFWSRGRDVGGRRNPFDLKTWQMVTATYDGSTLRLYKNGKRISQRQIELADDESVVRIAPIDPWDQERRFRGEIKNFTIWNTALPPEAVSVLQKASPQ